MVVSNVCLICKYPPIEGGASSKTYWLARQLGERGHTINIVSNNFEVEKEYRTGVERDDPDYEPRGVKVFETHKEDIEMHIPSGNDIVERMASLAMGVIDKTGSSIIDSWYLVPYAVVGSMIKSWQSLPLIIRHEGSDLHRICNSERYAASLKSVLKTADVILSYGSSAATFQNLGVNPEKIRGNWYSVPTRWFNPDGPQMDFSEGPAPSLKLGYIGKTGKGKKVNQLLQAVRMLKGKVHLMLATYDEAVRNQITSLEVDDYVTNLGFIPPWKVPLFIRGCDCMIYPESGFPVKQHTPVGPLESITCGKCTIVSQELFSKLPFADKQSGKHVLCVDSNTPTSIASVLDKLVSNEQLREVIASLGHSIAEQLSDFEGYVSYVEDIYSHLDAYSTIDNFK